MIVHRLKTHRAPFMALRMCRKTAEFRSTSDRTFTEGDLLCLEEFDEDHDLYTGNAAWRAVTHVLSGQFGVPEGYAMLSVTSIANAVKMGVVVERKALDAMRQTESVAPR